MSERRIAPIHYKTLIKIFEFDGFLINLSNNWPYWQPEIGRNAENEDISPELKQRFILAKETNTEYY